MVRSKGYLLIGWLMLVVLPDPARSATVANKQLDEVIRSKRDLAHGKQLFETCAACHGNDGGGARDGSVPAIAAQHFRAIAKELLDYQHNKRWDLRMEHFTDQHHLPNPSDIADVAAHIANLRPTPAPNVGEGNDQDHGAKVYARQCASCHGRVAEGSDRKGYPRLAHQDYLYLQQQIRDGAAGQRPNFSPLHVRLLEHLSRRDSLAVSDYLSRLGP